MKPYGSAFPSTSWGIPIIFALTNLAHQGMARNVGFSDVQVRRFNLLWKRVWT